ncbi:MAG TPA: UDP-N-acetylmuramoyl-L-alanine--D-glutamate ligase [Phycisphaerae bacterium]|nr:UDP-N-acetylmuramoyl-L-alanine--D-glutamate ligase [Phycisphaerae bacterium]
MPAPNPPTPLPSLANKRVLVMGLGRFGGGVGVSRWLVSQGAQVTVNDAARADKLADSLQQLEGLPITFKLGGHDPADFLAADLLVLNPAVDKRTSEPVQAALRAGIPYTTEINLFVERCLATTIGITGSVGKSTTTALIHEALKAGLHQTSDAPLQDSLAPPRVFLGGNIGRSLLLELSHIRPTDLVVLELSSFMLEDTPHARNPRDGSPGWSPHIAVVTNVYPNHLDRHGTMAQYAAAKQNILRFQKPGDTAILNNDHELVRRWTGLAESRGAAVIKYTTHVPGGPLPLAIPGEHNQSNARAALALLDALAPKFAVDRPAALHAIEQFPGLAHRLQLVHTLHIANRQIRFYNDSKATTPDASLTALDAFPPPPSRSAIFIVGGYDKHIDLHPFAQALAEKAGAVLGIGQTGGTLIDAIRAATPPSSTRLENAGTLEAAVAIAARWAKESPNLTAIVLSPASASYDQFPNYEKRGDLFIQLARSVQEGG